MTPPDPSAAPFLADNVPLFMMVPPVYWSEPLRVSVAPVVRFRFRAVGLLPFLIIPEKVEDAPLSFSVAAVAPLLVTVPAPESELTVSL